MIPQYDRLVYTQTCTVYSYLYAQYSTLYLQYIYESAGLHNLYSTLQILFDFKLRVLFVLYVFD